MLQVKATENTYNSKEDLKDNGFVWNNEEKCWERTFENESAYNEFMQHFMNVTYYGRKVVNKYHSQVVFVVEETKEPETKEKIVEMLKAIYECETPALVSDVNVNNSSYVKVPVDYFFDESSLGYILKDSWVLESIRKSTTEIDDIEEWAQEFSKENIESLRKEIERGNMYVANFTNSVIGNISVMIWKI